MFRHPAFFAALIRRDTQRETLFAQQHVSAITGVDAPDGVVLREMADITVVFVNIGFGMQSLHKIAAVAQRVDTRRADAGHYRHV